jgi:hypothetical protein
VVRIKSLDAGFGKILEVTASKLRSEGVGLIDGAYMIDGSVPSDGAAGRAFVSAVGGHVRAQWAYTVPGPETQSVVVQNLHGMPTSGLDVYLVGEPREPSRAQLSSPTSRAVTGKDGVAYFTGLHAGNHRLVVAKGSKRLETAGITVPSTRYTVVLPDLGAVQLKLSFGSGVAAGLLRDPRIHFYSSDRPDVIHTRSLHVGGGDQGLLVSAVPCGEVCWLYVSSGWYGQRRSVVAAEQPTVLEVDVHPIPDARCLVLDSLGRPCEGAYLESAVELGGSQVAIGSGRTGAGGAASLPFIPGSTTVTATMSNGNKGKTSRMTGKDMRIVVSRD